MPSVNDIVSRFGRRRSFTMLAVAIAGAAVLWSVASWATAPVWVPLYSDLPLEIAGEMGAKLEEAGVGHRLQRGGSVIEVAENDLARARVTLAQAGLPSKGRPGFELFDQPAWGMTDFTQRVNYRRALEGELERSIRAMRGIEDAQVHLALREGSSLRRSEKPVEASVLLKLTPGMTPGGEQVDAITFLIASSVEGLTTDNISVLDDGGRVLSAAVQPGSAGGATKRHVAMQRETESYLERRAEELLITVLGANNARVRVAADVNTERTDRTSLQFNPEQQVIMKEERSEVTPGAPEQGASSLSTNQTYEVSRTTETQTREPGGIRRLTVAVLVNENALPEGAEQTATLGRIESLVRNAVGLDATRGDGISVVSVPFEAPVAVPMTEPAPPPMLERMQQSWRPLVGVLAVVLGFILVLQALKAVRPVQHALPSAQQAPALAGMSAQSISFPPLEKSEQLRRHEELTSLVAERPENATRVIRAWMKDA